MRRCPKAKRPGLLDSGTERISGLRGRAKRERLWGAGVEESADRRGAGGGCVIFGNEGEMGLGGQLWAGRRRQAGLHAGGFGVARA